MTFKGLQGEWKIGFISRKGNIFIEYPEDAWENAKLISTAPNMLKMLEDIVTARRLGNDIPILEIEKLIQEIKTRH